VMCDISWFLASALKAIAAQYKHDRLGGKVVRGSSQSAAGRRSSPPRATELLL
jgi:hypothetical protein